MKITIISRFFEIVLGDMDLDRLLVGFLRFLAAGFFLFFSLTANDCFPYNDSTMGDIPSSLRNIHSKSVRDG